MPLLAGAVPRAWIMRGLPAPQLVLEPGRALVGRAGVTLYRVGAVKRANAIADVAVDGGMSDNPRPQLYDAAYTALLASRAEEPPAGEFRIVGKHCESGDVLIERVALPEPRRGDVLAVPATGAYTLGMASNYNGVPRPAAVLVGDGEARVILRRETRGRPAGARVLALAAAQLVLDGGRVEAARGEEDVAVEPEVGELLDQALVRLATRRRAPPRRPPPRPCARRRPGPARAGAATYEPCGRSFARSATRARATARSTRASPVWQAGPAGRTRSRIASPSQSSRISSTASVFPDVSPLCQSSCRERLQNHASPLSRVRRSASSSIQASIRTRPVSASWTIAGRQRPDRAIPAPSARSSARAAARAARGRSRRCSAASAPTANASARWRASPAPPEAITGTSTGLGDRRASARGRSRRACRRRRSR